MATPKRKQAFSLVPPPPPVVLPGAYNMPGFLTPQLDTYTPAPVKRMDSSVLDFMKPNAQGPAPLADVLTAQKSQLDSANRGLFDLNSGNGLLAVPDQVATSDFMKANVLPSIESQIIQNLSQANTAGSRFGKGFELGQQIAANLVAPAIGAFSKTPGTAAGTLQATEGLRQNVRLSRQQRTQESAALNQSLATLAGLYENLSPNSAKNINQLLSRQIEVSKANSERVNRAQKDVLDAQKQVADTEGKQLELLQKGKENYATALLSQGRNDLEAAQKEIQQKEFVSSDAERQANIANSQANTQLRAKEIADKNSQAGTQNETKQTELKLKALEQLDKFVSKNMANAMVTQASGQPKYKGFADYLASNPAVKAIYSQYAKAAGLEGVDPDHVFGALNQQEAPQGRDVWAELGGAVNNGLKSFPGMAQSAPPAAQAITGLEKQLGRRPTAKELANYLNGKEK